MNNFSIPAFIEELTPDAANAKYSHGKLKIFYVGETVDHRVFSKEFSDKLLATAAYTPVVGYYSVADEDFIGHNNVQHIYGLIPESAEMSYVEDTEQGVTFAVTDVILYTGRPDETGAIAAKIIGKQHSLELNPDTVKYQINRDETGAFKSIEFIDGELIGLSVLGDNDRPAFSGSEFFSVEEMPEFITEDNRGKYEALFNALMTIEPTAEEARAEIDRALRYQGICGYVCEHIQDKYAVVCTDYGCYSRFSCTRDDAGNLVLAFDANVRPRFLSDEEIESLINAKKGPTEIFEDVTDTEETVEVVGAETATSDNTTASAVDEDDDNIQDGEPATDNDDDEDDKDDEEFQTLRRNYESLVQTNSELTEQLNALTEAANAAREQFAAFEIIARQHLLDSYSTVLNVECIEQCKNIENYEALVSALADAYAQQKQNTETSVFEISFVDNSADIYDERDPAAVVQKYKNMNRGTN